MRIALIVPGKPQQWSRASRGQNGPSFTPANVVQQMDRLHIAWERDGKRRFPDDTPLQLHAGFFYERPKSHYRTGKFTGILKDGLEDVEPIGRPDIDNLVKLIGDTLGSHAFDDDSRVTVGGQIKAYLPRGTGPFTKAVLAPSSATWRRLILGELEVDLEEGQV
jgi:Holliday junction resolvase RusA-like endonuclease